MRRAGGRPVRLATGQDLQRVLDAMGPARPEPDGDAGPARPGDTHPTPPPRAVVGAIVDLSARRYDGVAAIGRITDAGLPVLAAAEHDDAALRRAALDAGALRVFAYRKLFTDGPRLIDAWLSPRGGRT